MTRPGTLLVSSVLSYRGSALLVQSVVNYRGSALLVSNYRGSALLVSSVLNYRGSAIVSLGCVCMYGHYRLEIIYRNREAYIQVWYAYRTASQRTGEPW